jgi:hypothetical protein
VRLKEVRTVPEGYVEDGLALAGKYGPCIRTIIQLLKGGRTREATFRQDLATQASALVSSERNIFNNFSSADITEAPHSSLIFIRPSSAEERHTYEFCVPTPEIARLLSAAVVTASNQEQHRFFTRMSTHPSTRSAAGWIYENFVHIRLTEKDGHVRAFDMSSHGHDIPTTTRIITGTVVELTSAEAPFYWRPGQSNFAGIDAIALFNHEIWAFQCTINSRHRSVITGLAKIAESLESTEWKWQLVIVGPIMSAAQSVQARQAALLAETAEWSRVKIYACELTLNTAEDRLTTLLLEVISVGMC